VSLVKSIEEMRREAAQLLRALDISHVSAKYQTSATVEIFWVGIVDPDAPNDEVVVVSGFSTDSVLQSLLKMLPLMRADFNLDRLLRESRTVGAALAAYHDEARAALCAQALYEGETARWTLALNAETPKLSNDVRAARLALATRRIAHLYRRADLNAKALYQWMLHLRGGAS
jgi:hypothetical protein